MKRLIKKSYDRNLDIREVVLKTTPLYPAFPDQHDSQYEDSTFKDSDQKSYQKMFNDFSMEQAEKRKNK